MSQANVSFSYSSSKARRPLNEEHKRMSVEDYERVYEELDAYIAEQDKATNFAQGEQS